MKRTLLLLSLVLTSVFSFAQVNPPTAIKARQDGSDNKAIIEWTASDATGGAVAGYKVLYKIKGAAKFDTSVVVKTLSHILTGLTLDTVYVVRVKAFKATVAPVDTTYSTNTDSVNVVIAKPLVKPAKPSIEPASTTPNRILFQIFDTNKYETGFEVKLEGEGSLVELTVGSGDAVLVNAQNLKPKTRYKITVRAVRTVTGQQSQYSDWSEPEWHDTKVALPPAATGFKTEADCPYGVAFSWNYAERQEDIIYVVVQASFDGWNFDNIGSVAANEKFFYYSGAEPGQNYFYRIVTQNSTGETLSGPYEIFTQRYVAPNPPKNVRSLQDATNKYTTFLTVAWDHGDQDNACKTNILANTEIMITVNGGAPKKLADLPNYIQQYRIEGLNPKDIVQISLRSYSDKGIISDWVSIVDTTFGPSDAPQNFIGVGGIDNFGNQVMYLSWDDTKDEGWYYVERSTDGTTFHPFTFLKQDITKLTDTQLEEGVTYFYRIKSANWAGESGYSRVIGPFFIGYTSAPNAPYGLVAKRSGNAVDLTWVDDSIKEEKYMVEKSTDNGENYVKIAELGRDATSFRDENISAGRTYVYRVRAWNSAFEFSPYSKPAKIEIPAATSGFVFDATVYPNPISETLNIKAEGVNTSSAYRLRIFDPNNHLVLDKEISFGDENTASVAIRSLAPGTYNLTLSDGKERISKKIVKL